MDHVTGRKCSVMVLTFGASMSLENCKDIQLFGCLESVKWNGRMEHWNEMWE